MQNKWKFGERCTMRDRYKTRMKNETETQRYEKEIQ